MKKWLFCTLVVVMVPILSYGGFGGEDVAKLRPVQVVAVSAVHGGVQLRTDTGDLGIGLDIPEAMESMKQTSPAMIFLDTAEYLLIEPGAEVWLSQLSGYLRPSCNLCYMVGEADLKKAGEYLQLHQPDLTLVRYEAGERQLPQLIINEGRMELVQP